MILLEGGGGTAHIKGEGQKESNIMMLLEMREKIRTPQGESTSALFWTELV